MDKKTAQTKEYIYLSYKSGLKKEFSGRISGEIIKQSDTYDRYTTISNNDCADKTLIYIDSDSLINALKENSIIISKGIYVKDTLSFTMIKELCCEHFSKFKTVTNQKLITTTLDYELVLNNTMELITIKRSIKEFCDASNDLLIERFKSDLLEMVKIYGNKIKKINSLHKFQTMDLILSHGAGGVLVHEAIGHCLEADCLFENGSILLNKLNERVCNSNVNISDIPFKNIQYSSDNTIAKPVELVKDGIISNVMTDAYTSKVYKIKDTGNGRRSKYNSFVMPRMRCTYLHNGKLDSKDIINSIHQGLWVTDFGAAHVDTQSGDFVLFIERAVLIKEGGRVGIVENVLYKGNVLDTLNRIDLIANDLSFYGALCGKQDQYVPVIYGQPTISIKEGFKYEL